MMGSNERCLGVHNLVWRIIQRTLYDGFLNEALPMPLFAWNAVSVDAKVMIEPSAPPPLKVVL